MKANELRIGNYVELLGNTTEIEYISKLPMRNTMYWLKCKDYIDTKIIHFNPIPLTEEWLVIFGFEKTEDLSKGIDNPSFYYIDGNDFIIDSDFTFNTEFLDVELIHVHQLQNLYFALTGEELTSQD